MPVTVPVRYTIPAPIRGFRLPGVIGRTGVGALDGSLNADERDSLDGVVLVDGKLTLLPEAVRALSVSDGTRAALVDTLRVEGALRLLCDDLGFRLEPCGRRRGRGPEACRDTGGSALEDAWPTDACAEPLEEDDNVLSRGNGRVPCIDGVFKLVLDGIRRAAADFPGVYDHDPASSSPTGVNGSATLDPETLDGVMVPGS